MPQCKAQRCRGFPTSRGYRQRIDSGRQFTSFAHTILQNLISYTAEYFLFVAFEIRFFQPLFYMVVKTFCQNLQGIIFSPDCLILLHKRFRIQIIRIYQAGIHHPNKKRHRKTGIASTPAKYRNINILRYDISLPCRIIRQTFRAFYSSKKRAVSFIGNPVNASIQQPGMMPGNRHCKRYVFFCHFHRLNRPSSRMIHLCRVFRIRNPPLKCLGILSNIVKKSAKISLFSTTELLRKLLCQTCGPLRMAFYCLNLSARIDVSNHTLPRHLIFYHQRPPLFCACRRSSEYIIFFCFLRI